MIYTRVSTEDQAEKGYSLRHQEDRLRQHCHTYDIEVAEHFQDDTSAKTFDRPAFQDMLKYLNTNKRNIDLLLVLKWDRFSRNMTQALNMLATLKELGIQVDAIEQSLDDDIPENLILQAVFLATPEVENRRRARATTQGMRRAKKEGRWVGKAPKGYKNTRDSSNRPIVIPNEDAHFVQLAFQKMAQGAHYMDQIRKELNAQGFKISKNIFAKMLRNPFYTGKIRIEAWKDEPEEVVEGIHEALIDEDLFNKVQRIIQRANGHRRDVPKRQHNDLPLRGYLVCRKCGGNLTGSKTRGNGGEYYYYHCQKGCKERFRASEANGLFLEFLDSFSPPREVAQLYLNIMEDIFREKEGTKDEALARVKKEITKEEERLTSATEKYVDEKIGYEAYQRLERRLNKKIQELRHQQSDLEEMETNFDKYARYGMALISDLPGYFKKADLPIQQKMIGLIFPEKLTYDNGKYRTKRLNEAITLFGGLEADFGAKKEELTNLLNGQPSGVAL